MHFGCTKASNKVQTLQLLLSSVVGDFFIYQIVLAQAFLFLGRGVLRPVHTGH